MDINPDIRERILNAAQQLFEASGRLELPTVDCRPSVVEDQYGGTPENG